MTLGAAPAGDSERSAALEGWVAAFDDEFEQCGDFSTSVAAMKEHGCFDVRAVVERWILANPCGDATLLHLVPPLEESVPPEPVLEEAPRVAAAPHEPEADGEPAPPRPNGESTPDVAYFHSLLQGGIERAEIYEAFPGFHLAIAEAVENYGAAAPILSDAPRGPTREDLNDEIRGMREKLLASGKRDRRRWRRA